MSLDEYFYRLESIYVKIQMKRWGTRQSATNTNASTRKNDYTAIKSKNQK